MSTLCSRFGKRAISPPRVTGVYPLERAGDAIAHLAARKAIGKLVVEIG